MTTDPTDPVDRRIRDAARRFGTEVDDVVDVDLALGSTTGRRRRGPAPLLVAVAVVAALAGVLALGVDDPDEAVEVAVDEDGDRDDTGDRERPDLDRMPAPIALGAPTDGKDSVGLPVRVEPATGLVDGQTVTVTGTGFPPGESIGVVMCTREAGRDYGARGAEACNLGRYAPATSSSDGVVVVEFQVQRLMSLDGREVDCASEADRCLVGMGLISDYDQSGGALVSFDDDAPLPDPPTSELSRATGLANGEEVDLRITGLRPGSGPAVELCDTGRRGCADSGLVLDPADGDGVIDQTITLWRAYGVYGAHGMPDAGSSVLDCALEPCVLHFHGDTATGRAIPPIEIRFDPAGDAPEPPTAALVDPGPFAPGDTVAIEVSGLADGVHVDATLCAPASGECVGAGAAAEGGRARIDIVLPPTGPYTAGGCECFVVISAYRLDGSSGMPPVLHPEPVPVTLTG